MAEAQISLKLTPREFDIVRRALHAHAASQHDLAKSSINPREKAEARTEQALTTELVTKLK